LKAVLPMRRFDTAMTIDLVKWIQYRNHRSYLSHRKRRMAIGEYNQVSL
jgi:hypothetical protein